MSNTDQRPPELDFGVAPTCTLGPTITSGRRMERDETQGFELLPMVEGKEPDIARGQARFAVGMLRQLAKGSPVPAAFPASLAAELELDWQSANAVLLRNAERNARGDIVGFGGLSLRPDHPHRFRVNGLQFTTWCAWDTLFLPSLLMQDAVVETPDPDSGALIHVQVTDPSGAEPCAARHSRRLFHRRR